MSHTDPKATSRNDSETAPHGRTKGTLFRDERFVQTQRLLARHFRNPETRGKVITAKEIGAHVGVTPKTVGRDIKEMIVSRGLPIEPILGGKGGYRLKENVTEFPDLPLTEGELFILALALRALAAYRGTAKEATIRSVVEKLLATLGDGMTVNMKKLEEMVTFLPGGYEAPVDLEVFETVMQALLDQKELVFQHTKPDPEAKPQERRVQPRHLATIGCNWYLFTDDPQDPTSKEKQRKFALTRVDGVKATEKAFTPAEPFDLDVRLNGSIGVHTGGQRQTVTLHFARKVRTFVLERRWHAKQRVKELGDGVVEVSFDAPVNEELVRWVMGWGADLKVVEPAELREAVRAEARRMLEE